MSSTRPCWIISSAIVGLESFRLIFPDCLIELRSRRDRLKPLQEKMQESLDSGLQVGLLIDPQDQQVEVYRGGEPKQVLRSPQAVTIGDLMPGFALSLRSTW